MKHPRKPPETPGLFDLLLEPERTQPGTEPPASEEGSSIQEPQELLLFSEAKSEEPKVRQPAESTDSRPTAPAVKPARPHRRPASLSARLTAGLIDLGVLLSVTLTIALGTRSMGIELAWEDGPAVLVFLLAFSFLYLVPPLAFWGRTPGMGWAGLVARAQDDQPLTFQQTVVRWLGTLLTLAALGLPLLLSLTGSSLSDRLSRSRTYHTNL